MQKEGEGGQAPRAKRIGGGTSRGESARQEQTSSGVQSSPCFRSRTVWSSAARQVDDTRRDQRGRAWSGEASLVSTDESVDRFYCPVRGNHCEVLSRAW